MPDLPPGKSLLEERCRYQEMVSLRKTSTTKSAPNGIQIKVTKIFYMQRIMHDTSRRHVFSVRTTSRIFFFGNLGKQKKKGKWQTKLGRRKQQRKSANRANIPCNKQTLKAMSHRKRIVQKKVPSKHPTI